MLVGLVPERLCTARGRPFPPPRLAPIVRTALDWQMIGSHAAFWSLGGVRVRIRSGPGRMHELAGLTAAIGEQLGLACAADHEVDSWLALKAPRQTDTAVQREMSTRAMLERLTGLRFNREREEVDARLAGEPGGDVR